MNSLIKAVACTVRTKMATKQMDKLNRPTYFFQINFEKVMSLEEAWPHESFSFLHSLSSVELAMIMDRLYGGVCYAGIDTDPELKYPKGAGRVAFSNQQSYIAAISARFVQLQHNDIDKRVSEFMHFIHSVLPPCSQLKFFTVAPIGTLQS